MYEVDIPTDTEEQGTDQYDREDSSEVFIDPAVAGNFVRIQRYFITNMENTRTSHHLFGKPYIPHSSIHPLALLSASYLQEKIEKLLNQVSSDEWKSSIWIHIKYKV